MLRLYVNIFLIIVCVYVRMCSGEHLVQAFIPLCAKLIVMIMIKKVAQKHSLFGCHITVSYDTKVWSINTLALGIMIPGS